MSVTVAVAGPADVAAIRALDGLSAVSRRQLERELDRRDRCGLVARLDGEVVGYASVLVGAGELQLLDLAVAVTHRRRGIATTLVTELRRHARDLEADAVTLEVRESNTPARALYRRLGFLAVGRRPAYYPDGPDGHREAAVIMADRHLGRD